MEQSPRLALDDREEFETIDKKRPRDVERIVPLALMIKSDGPSCLRFEASVARKVPECPAAALAATCTYSDLFVDNIPRILPRASFKSYYSARTKYGAMYRYSPGEVEAQRWFCSTSRPQNGLR